MSFEPDSPKNELTIEEHLECICRELKLLNLRLEDAFETGIEIEDIDE